MKNSRLETGIKVSKVTMIGNALLTIVKIAIGILASSSAMVADGVHSLSDVISTIVVMVGLKLSSKPEDDNHQYGHERIESLAAILLSIMLFIVAIGIGYSAIKNIMSGNITEPGMLAIFAAILSIVTKEWMYRYTLKYAISIDSPSLKADAWHHRSDALSSIGALAGIAGAKLGFTILDPIAGIIIAVIIIKVSYDILKQGVEQIIDHKAGDEVVDEIKNKINSVSGVCDIDLLKTRLHGNRVYVDVEISVDSELTVAEGHDIAMKVHNKIEEDRKVKHCMVHVNPAK